jgi:hypothetical protein
MYLRFLVVLRRLFRVVLRSPRLVMLLSVACSLAAMVTAVIGARRGGHVSVVPIILVSLGAGLSALGLRLARPRRLRPKQRQALLQALGRTAPVEVRVAAVSDPEAVRYARELRNAMNAAHWPAMGIFKCNGDAPGPGVTVAVRNVVTPPAEAITLMNALRRIGVPAIWQHKPQLTADHTIEVLVGRSA